MSNNRCKYGFIPPFILKNLAKAGMDEVRLSIHQSELSREKRSSKVISMDTLMGVTTAAPGTASREVWDSQNKSIQRVKLVRDEGKPPTADEAVNNAYDYAGSTKDAVLGSFQDYLKVLGRNSIDNKGMNLILNVHFGVKYMNAFWDGDEMTFGDGDGTIFVNFTKSLDVIAHEAGHGVVQFTANLKYYSQSGALNEHFADVFGAAVTQYKEKQTAQKADWLIGDEIMGPDLYGEALRSMKAPGTAYDNPLLGKDPQPDHMKNYYTGAGDNQGVHINSGIPNKVFYLVAMEIGTDKAMLIWYNALQKLWITANFNDAVKVIVETTRLLVKSKKVPKGTTQTVRAAFKSVGLPT